MHTGLKSISKKHYETLLGIHAEVVLEAAIEGRLRKLIDQALDRRDEVMFRKYVAELTDMKKGLV
ncbi:IDEAL domain-containing protein [Paenibacillus donghaensis]|uniref:IDEAL domain-containing protein n=1 Tax=Paenibacillus donghaensis TaxID=414771 RepID=A0A2Z2K6U7_9BACL|nr:IDEAL domain-containing protein [Paenibacillus donghaensis]ASA21986.1 hypothetical protein B9T62_15090 [Paenibacillus donghaensis]